MCRVSEDKQCLLCQHFPAHVPCLWAHIRHLTLLRCHSPGRWRRPRGCPAAPAEHCTPLHALPAAQRLLPPPRAAALSAPAPSSPACTIRQSKISDGLTSRISPVHIAAWRSEGSTLQTREGIIHLGQQRWHAFSRAMASWPSAFCALAFSASSDWRRVSAACSAAASRRRRSSAS